MKLTILRAGIPILACMPFVSIGFADVIAVSNPSFEIVTVGGLPLGCGSACAFSEFVGIPGWATAGAAGQFQPGTQGGNTSFFSSLSDGITSAYSNGPTITQTVGATVQVGVTYTLQLDLGHRNDLPFDATADLLIGGVTVIPAVGVTPTPGNWSTFTASFIGLPTEAGDAITIELHSSGDQANFDNVRLSDVLTTGPVPEPNSFALLGTAVIGLAMWARHRSKRLV